MLLKNIKEQENIILNNDYSSEWKNLKFGNRTQSDAIFRNPEYQLNKYFQLDDPVNYQAKEITKCWENEKEFSNKIKRAALKIWPNSTRNKITVVY